MLKKYQFYLIFSIVAIALLFITTACSNENTEKTTSDETIIKENAAEENNKEADYSNEQIPLEKEEDIVHNPNLKRGNHSGNILAGGLIDYSNGWFYFANILDDYRLYKMTVDGEQIIKLTDVSVRDIHVIDDEWVYYVTTNDPIDNLGVSINRISIHGGSQENLFEGSVYALHVSNDQLVFLHLQTQKEKSTPSMHTLSMSNGKLENLYEYGYSISVENDDFLLVSAGELFYGNLKGYSETVSLGYIVGNENALLSNGKIIAKHLNFYYETEVSDNFQYINLSEAFKEKPIDLFNVIEDEIYFTAAHFEVDRSLYVYNIKDKSIKQFPEYLTEIYTFDEYFVGFFARQGGGGFLVINRDNEESWWINPFAE